MPCCIILQQCLSN